MEIKNNHTLPLKMSPKMGPENEPQNEPYGYDGLIIWVWWFDHHRGKKKDIIITYMLHLVSIIVFLYALLRYHC